MFKLPELPYDKDAFGDVMTEQTFDFHYGKHHKGYLDKLNELIKDSNLEDKTIEQVIKHHKGGPLYNNAAQYWNHSFFWKSISPEKPDIPTEAQEVIEDSWNNVSNCNKDFVERGMKQFGSGWLWLAGIFQQNKLQRTLWKTTNNAVTLLNDKDYVPLLVIDLWEHAYYLDYQNDRKKYLETIWKYIDWSFVLENIDQQSKR